MRENAFEPHLLNLLLLGLMPNGKGGLPASPGDGGDPTRSLSPRQEKERKSKEMLKKCRSKMRSMKILLAIDDSMFSEAVTPAVIQLIRPEHTELCVLHVVDAAVPIPIPTSYAGEYRKESLKQGKDLVGLAELLLAQAGYKVKTAVEEGEPRAKIIDYAASWKAELVLVGSHGRKGLDRFLMGSVVEFVARHAACSVLIVRAPSVR
jgi:nucleotide-binding universal stress UspA family protein